MKSLFYLIVAIFLMQNFVAEGFCADLLEEEKINIPSNKKIKSVEELTAELAAQESAAQPFDDKNIKVDVESLGLDTIDDKKNQNIAKPTKPEEPRQTSVGESNLVNIKGEVESKKNDNEIKIFSKIKNFINNATSNKTTAADNLATPVPQNFVEKKAAEKKLRAEKKAQLQKRIAEEKRVAASKREALRKEEKMIRLQKLREEYLAKLREPNSAENEKDNISFKENKTIMPQEKSFSWSSRFVSYESPPPPIADPRRGYDNKHIPTIETVQDRIDDMFLAIPEKNGAAYFNSAYQYVLDPNIRNASGDSILTYATLLQKYAIMSSILAKGADPDLPNALGHTALDIAIETLDLKSAQILIAMNANVNYVDGIGRTYLMHAARTGFLPMVDLLVSQGVDVNAINDEGFTALAIAYRHKKDVIAKFLIKNGAKPWIKKPYNPEKQNLIKELENRWKK